MPSISAAAARLAALAAAPVLVLTAIVQLADDQSAENTTVGIEHLSLAGLTASLLLLAPVTLHLGERAGRSRLTWLPLAGMVALAMLTTVSNVRGSDPSFFAAVAVPANLLWLTGWVSVAARNVRAGTLPTWQAVLLPVCWVLILPMSVIGGSLLAAAYFAKLAADLHRELRPVVAVPAV